MEPKSIPGKHQMTTKNAAFFEMAGRIPGEIKAKKKGSDILIVAVGSDEKRGEAHFHVFKNKNDFENWKNGACLCFKENKYFDHDSHKESLTKDEIKVLMDILGSKPDESLPGNTYWQYLIYLWNGNNFDFRIDINTPIQGYNYDTITRYKEYSETRNNRGIDEEFLEMATIKWGFMSIKLAIYGDEGSGYPHFHFYKNLKPEEGIPASYRSGGGCLAIESANYFVHGGHQEKLNPEEIKGLRVFLKEKNRSINSITNWEYIVGMWNDNNPDQKQLPTDIQIPDYRSDMGIVNEEPNRTIFESSGLSPEEKDKCFFEMTGRVPDAVKDNDPESLVIAVGSGEILGEAHFHVFKNKDDFKNWENGASLLFDRNEYFNHDTHIDILSEDELSAVVKCLHSKPADGLPGDSYWQYLIYLWNGNNSGRPYIDPGMPMTEYNYETITTYEEGEDGMSWEAFRNLVRRIPGDKSEKCKLAVAVGPYEGHTAHFHVFRSEEDLREWKNGACLCFTGNRYYDHQDNAETLTKDELNILISLLKKPYKWYQNITNWQHLVHLWNDNNDRYEIPNDTEMPEYDYETITRYKAD